ncbi:MULTISPECIES: hypothetical protein [unclassified Arthrobacter]|uniref:hypothetical protein n=1 Tax=unclassified Arthrobacter TaxID=235627 RepID=UPI0011B0A24E|nr:MULTISPECIES: hypothetical protein [unclassified Arthrobacter]
MTTVLSGCIFTPLPEPTVAGLVGVWVNGQTRLFLRDDQTFTLDKAPLYTDPGEDQDWRLSPWETYDWEGRWKIDLTGYELDLSGTTGRNLSLYFGEVDSKRALYFAIDAASDPRCFQLVKGRSKSVPQGPDQCMLRA